VRHQGGGVQCWGAGGLGQLGDGNRRDSPRPVTVRDLGDAEELALGAQHSCARQRSGTVVCWGSNANGELGDGEGRPGAASASPVAVRGLNDATQLRAGKHHTCALRRGGSVLCWGDNHGAQLGNEGRQIWVAPVQVAGLANAVELAAGTAHTCARTNTGKVLCWGSGAAGQLGDASPRRPAPAPVPNLADATLLVAGGDHTCALRRAGPVVCWGAGFAKTPTAVPGVEKVADLSAGEDHTCSRSNGALTCWGSNQRGQLGDGTLEARAAGTRVRNLPDVKAVAAGAHHTCALTRAGGVMCWGGNDGAALGAGLLPSGGDDGQAGTVRNLTDATDLSSGDGFSCAVAGGSVQCWGAGGLGQLGDGALADRSLAQPALGIADAVQVAAGTGHACARRSSGQVSCWGQNGSGQLGDGSKAMRNHPVAVDGLSDAVQLAAGGEHTCAVRRAGPVVCWGKGATGQLGNGKKEDSARPVGVDASVNQVVQLALGTDHSCALQSGRRVLCWGGNFFGQVGSGHTVGFPELLTPQIVQKVADAVEVSAGDEHTCIRRSTGFLACWGKGDVGQLGANITSNWSTRVPVTGITSATALSAGRAYTCAAAPGQVMCWGNNSAGQLGNGSRSPSKVPVAGQRIADVSRLAAGVDHTCALRSSGRVMCWGSNQRGQLGDGTTAQSLAPLAVLDLP
jgi:alpha-tubulin suppressor-like RCC1 family protein